MKNTLIGIACGLVIAAGVFAIWIRAPSSGPHGGDLVPLEGAGYGEVLANGETGEAIVLICDTALKRNHPISNDPIALGSGARTVVLMPRPLDDDPPGACSRFYGHADWLRGGSVRHGWLHWHGHGVHHRFAWAGCWDAGRARASLWPGVREHHGAGSWHHADIQHE
jgi:hypothetical protein